MKLRYDSDGLFWETPPPDPTARSKSPRRLAPIPEATWAPPKALPSLTGVRRIALDVETFDPNLRTHGPGWARGDGHVVGISLAVGPNQAMYLPFRHTVQREMNMDSDVVLGWAREELPKVSHIIGANLMYDVGWLEHEGVHFNRSTKFHDVQFAEPLLNDTSRGYSLDALAEKYLGEQKKTSELYRWCARSYGGQPFSDQRKNIWRAPPTLVGPYAEADAYLPFRIIELQYAELCRQDLAELFSIECRLIPLLVAMRRRGVRVDVAKAEQVRETILKKASEVQEALNKTAGFEVNINNAEGTLEKLFDGLGVAYPRTEKGNPSFTAAWLENQTTPEAAMVRELRTLAKMQRTFVEGYVLDSHVDGRLYCQFHPLRTDESGAVSGRFSSSTPNLQNIPARDPFYGPLIRGMFLPDEGAVQWRKYDYSQIEYRMFAHFSGDAGLLRAYQDPATDFHVVAGEMLGGSMPRVVVKTFNFMTLYGGGVPALASMLQGLVEPQQALELLESMGGSHTGDVYLALAYAVQSLYHERFPAARQLAHQCMDEAAFTGEIRTLLGRVNRFPFYVPARSHYAVKPLPLDQARQEYGSHVVRAYTHKALNRKLQGSAADLMKYAMLRCYEDGLYDHLGVPHLTVHDETDHSDFNPTDPAWEEMKHVMENCIKLKVPVKVDLATGPNWGQLGEET